MAKLYFRYGVMGSSKTANALMVRYNYEERGQDALLVKPAVDQRDGARFVASRAGLSHDCIYFSDLMEMTPRELKPYACIIVDEAQFLTRDEVRYLTELVDDWNIPVICYGLRADFMMKGFPGSTRLLELAHTIEEMKTICACGRKATCNGRKVNGQFVFEGEQIAIDTVDHVEYESLCPQCWYREYRAYQKRQGKTGG